MMVWGSFQMMAGEEVRNQNFREHMKHHLQNEACHQHLTFFFRPPLAVDVYERLRRLVGVEVGRGEGGGRCHDGGEGWHEVSPRLVFT